MHWKIEAQLEIRKIMAVLRKDKYDRIAAELSDVLLRNWDKATKEAIKNVIRGIKGREPFTASELESTLQALSARLGPGFANRVAAPLFELQTSTYGNGLKDIVQVSPTFNQIDNKAIAALEQHNIFWVREFWDRQLGEQVKEIGQSALKDGLTRRDAGKLFQDAFADRFQQYGIRYWQGFATHVITRSRELGRVSGYERSRATEIEIRAILDHRTTPICREMHGRVFKVADAVKLRNSIMNAETPEDVVAIAPWMKPEQVQGKKSPKLSNGLALPPYHFNCRTRSIKRRSVQARNQVTSVEFGKRIDSKMKKALSGRSADEWSGFVQDIRGRKSMRFNREDLQRDLKRQGAGVNEKGFLSSARKSIRESQTVLVQMIDGEKRFTFHGKEGVATVDDGLQIREFIPHKAAKFVEADFNKKRPSSLLLNLNSPPS